MLLLPAATGTWRMRELRAPHGGQPVRAHGTCVQAHGEDGVAGCRNAALMTCNGEAQQPPLPHLEACNTCAATAPDPTQGAPMEKKGTPASPATALASNVFPVPAGRQQVAHAW